MKYWWNENWPFVGIMLGASLIFIGAYFENKYKKDEYDLKFSSCMADIHNMYVCDIYARGKDTEILYVPLPQ